MPDLKVVDLPETYADSAKQLRRMADDVEKGSFGTDPHVVCVISSSDGIRVRGLGTVDGLIAIATLNLGLSWLVGNTLRRLNDV